MLDDLEDDLTLDKREKIDQHFVQINIDTSEEENLVETNNSYVEDLSQEHFEDFFQPETKENECDDTIQQEDVQKDIYEEDMQQEDTQDDVYEENMQPEVTQQVYMQEDYGQGGNIQHQNISDIGLNDASTAYPDMDAEMNETSQTPDVSKSVLYGFVRHENTRQDTGNLDQVDHDKFQYGMKDQDDFSYVPYQSSYDPGDAGIHRYRSPFVGIIGALVGILIGVGLFLLLIHYNYFTYAIGAVFFFLTALGYYKSTKRSVHFGSMLFVILLSSIVIGAAVYLTFMCAYYQQTDIFAMLANHDGKSLLEYHKQFMEYLSNSHSTQANIIKDIGISYAFELGACIVYILLNPNKHYN